MILIRAEVCILAGDMPTGNKYFRSYGKLTRQETIILDSRMKDVLDQARAKGFNVQEWARDALSAHLGELMDMCGIDENGLENRA